MGVRNVHESPPGWVGGFVRCQRGHQKDQESDPMPIFDNLKSFLASHLFISMMKLKKKSKKAFLYSM